MEQYQDCHNLTVGHHTPTVTATLAGGVERMFFNSGAKYLQNLSRIQKVSIKFAVVMEVDTFM